ncbi:siderophore-interacting protein [Rheinheimera riviphila]|nr:siderophore-interacting protein [Rheinheimera riviphila]
MEQLKEQRHRPVPQAPARIRLVQVVQSQPVSANLRRITLTGSALAEPPHYWPACHVKLLLPKPGQLQPLLPVFGEHGPVWPDQALKPDVRTFTVRAHRPELAEVDIDVAIHGDSSPASRFALHCKRGDYCALSLPGGPQPMLPPNLPFLLVGDMTALPAICAMLEQLPADAQGTVFCLVSSHDDIPQLKVPVRVTCHWLVGNYQQTALLIDTVKAAPLPAPGSSIWLAGEEQIVLQLRRYLRHQLPLQREQLYAIPYWRAGLDEAAYEMPRHQVMDDNAPVAGA